jgi:hypothetical protein
MTLKDLQDLIKSKIKTKELNLKLYNTIRGVLVKHDGKRLNVRLVDNIRYELIETFGEDFFKTNLWLSKQCSMSNLKLEIKLDNGYSYSYLLSHEIVNVIIDIKKIEEHNRCWSLELDRIHYLERDLLKTDYLKDIVKNINQLNKADTFLESISEYENNCEFYYDLQKTFNNIERRSH